MSKEIKGGGFLLEDTGTTRTFLPEQLDSEVLDFGQAAYEFIDREVLPRVEDMQDQSKKVEVNLELLKKAGEQGLLMVEIPEKYEGLGMGLKASMHVSERVTQDASFATSMLAHTGIGSLPIVYFGNEDQKSRYLPKLASGEWLAAYALTEANHGSDALGAKTHAVLSEDGKHYILNGEKVYITNAGFADLFIVYAKIDRKDFSAFIVERTWEGVDIGAEEKKMGIKGSSTCSLILEDVKVPVENLLGGIGEGHKSALGILDVGRFKLGVASLGMAKRMIGIAAAYANERKQFQKSIGSFGMIRRKLADMASGTFAVESMAYRTAGMMDDRIEEFDHDAPDFSAKVAKVFEEYDIECSTMKVLGSEVGSMVIDDALQIHGGYGFIEEYEVARVYRDERINRIFEGTNEINRLLVPGTFMKRSMTGRMPVIPEANKLIAKLAKGEVPAWPEVDGPLAELVLATESARRLALWAFGGVMKQNLRKIRDVDHMMGKAEYHFERLADMIMDVYAMSSSACRARQIIEEKGEDKARMATLLAGNYVFQALQRAQTNALAIAADLAEGDGEQYAALKAQVTSLVQDFPFQLLEGQDEIAANILDREKYFA